MDCNDHREFFAKPGTSNRDQRENAEAAARAAARGALNPRARKLSDFTIGFPKEM
jgi:hypothetical protein